MSFSGKVAIVAGAGGGMGLNIANDLIAAGAKVTLADLKDRPGKIAGGPGPGAGESAYHQGDVTDEAFVSQVVAETVAAHGGLDSLVNTTGVLWFGRDRSLVDIDMEVWDRVLAINLKSHALTARHAIPAMIASGGGAMVHISSLDALRGARELDGDRLGHRRCLPVPAEPVKWQAGEHTPNWPGRSG